MVDEVVGFGDVVADFDVLVFVPAVVDGAGGALLDGFGPAELDGAVTGVPEDILACQPSKDSIDSAPAGEALDWYIANPTEPAPASRPGDASERRSCHCGRERPLTHARATMAVLVVPVTPACRVTS